MNCRWISRSVGLEMIVIQKKLVMQLNTVNAQGNQRRISTVVTEIMFIIGGALNLIIKLDRDQKTIFKPLYLSSTAIQTAVTNFRCICNATLDAPPFFLFHNKGRL